MAISVVTHVACKKDTGSIGLDSGDAALQPFTIDTFTLITRTVREDSLRSDQTSYQLLGALNSADFGRSTAGMAVSFALPNSSFVFPAGVVIDSVVFQAAYTGATQYVGDLNTPMNYVVEEVNQRLYADSGYYSSQQIPGNNSQNFNGILHKLTDSVTIVENGVSRTYEPHLRLNLSQAYINKFQNAQPGNLGSNSSFQDYFNGLKITCNGSGLGIGQGNVIYFNMNSPISGIAVYYNDTGKYVFPVGTNGAKINLFTQDFSGVPGILTQLNDTNGNFNNTYVQSMSGLKTRIDIPNLLNLVDSGVYAVIDASIQIHYDEAFNSTEFPAFSRTLLLKRDSNNRNNFVMDQLLNSDFYGGTRNTNGYYEFRVTREIQDILNNYRLNGLNRNTGFFLIAPSDNPISASRMMMDTQKGVARGIKFKLKLVKTK